MLLPACPLCGTLEWRALENIRDDRSVRTDGGVIASPLSKFHCSGCGLAIRAAQDQGPSTLYGEDYQLYSNRPGADQFDAVRYANITGALHAAWGLGDPPRRVLEAGCGDGSLLQAVQLRWPEAAVVGLEPSHTAVEFARSSGRAVFQGMIGQATPEPVSQGGFDLIYAVHVIEHTPDPSAFLSALAPLLAPGGRIIITCPDGAVPHAELVHSDHLFSMTPGHLASFARRGGQEVLMQGDCPAGIHAEFSQLMVCAPAGAADRSAMRMDRPFAEALYRDRQAYLGLWKGLEAYLMESVRRDEPLYCFGAGGWTGNIAGYCPNLWAQVAGCVVDGGEGAQVHGKRVGDYGEVKGEPRQFIAVVNPALQARIAERLKRDDHRVVAWPSLLTA